MSKCDKCGREEFGCILNSHGYHILCEECHEELVRQDYMRTVEQMSTTDCIHDMDGRQLVKNFVAVFCEYQKDPDYKKWDVMWRLFCMACHEDHTASCAISEILKWQGFDWWKEEKKCKEKEGK